MSNLQSMTAVSLGDASASLSEWLGKLHQRGRLQPLLQEAILEEFLVRKAESCGLRVSEDDLQKASDGFRRRHGLTSAATTQAWLERGRLSVADFESTLERDLLLAKLKEKVTRDKIAGHFTAHQAEYNRTRLRQILVDREDLAQELMTQIHEENANVADLAERHSLHRSKSVGGSVGWMMRRQLSPPIAEAVFAAKKGTVIGPLATPEGYHLFLVEDFAPAQLDSPTASLVRDEVFNAWLNEELKGARLTMPLLEMIDVA